MFRSTLCCQNPSIYILPSKGRFNLAGKYAFACINVKVAGEERER
jgi:hypothetical protein